MANKKLRVGFFSFTGCEGCMVIFLEILNDKFFKWRDFLEFKYFKLLKSQNEITDIDVAFIEGAIATYKGEEFIKEIRNNSKKLVAIGTCAINGAPSNHRNFFDDAKKKEIAPLIKKFKHRDKVVGVSDIVKVDDTVPGCPIVEEKFVETMEKYLKLFGVRK